MRPATGSSIITRRRGAVVVLFALMLPVLLGMTALAVELSLWFLRQRDMQNAADAAVLTASVNDIDSKSTNYAAEAAAVAARYGYVNGANHAGVSIARDVPCPSGQGVCYQATITSALPLLLTPVLGITGATVPGAVQQVVLSVTAMATQTVTHSYCLLALASGGGTGIVGKGSPTADLSHCSIMSNGDASCVGHDLRADYGDAHGINDGCGVVRNSNVPAMPDPFQVLHTNIPPTSCPSYPQKPVKKNDPPLPAGNLWTGTKTWSGNQVICGDLQLTGDVNIGGSAATLVIVNGQLDTNGFTLRTGPGSGLTIVFTGTSSAAYTHAPTGGGTLDIVAPTSGAWSGIAIYQDPALTAGVDIAGAGNSPTWNITGVVYLPHAAVAFNGAVSKATNGEACFGLVVNTIDVRGTAAIYPSGNCVAAGVNLPKNIFRGKLVL
jgi:Flp pilus assembly protein TadG